MASDSEIDSPPSSPLPIDFDKIGFEIDSLTYFANYNYGLINKIN